MSLAGTTVDATTQEDFHTWMVLLGAGFFGAGQRMAPDLGKNRSCRGEPSTCLRLSCWPCS